MTQLSMGNPEVTSSILVGGNFYILFFLILDPCLHLARLLLGFAVGIGIAYLCYALLRQLIFVQFVKCGL